MSNQASTQQTNKLHELNPAETHHSKMTIPQHETLAAGHHTGQQCGHMLTRRTPTDSVMQLSNHVRKARALPMPMRRQGKHRSVESVILHDQVPPSTARRLAEHCSMQMQSTARCKLGLDSTKCPEHSKEACRAQLHANAAQARANLDWTPHYRTSPA
jgi:hypothetical protein